MCPKMVGDNVADITTFRSKRGFSLIEAVVVAVIALILASVGIPLYIGYVDGARRDAVTNLAQTGAAAASSYWKKTQSPIPSPIGPNTNPLNLYFDERRYSMVTYNVSYISVWDRSRPAISASARFR